MIVRIADARKLSGIAVRRAVVFALMGLTVSAVIAPVESLSARGRWDPDPHRTIVICNAAKFDHVSQLRKISEAFDKTRGMRILEFEHGSKRSDHVTVGYISDDYRGDDPCLKNHPGLRGLFERHYNKTKDRRECTNSSSPDRGALERGDGRKIAFFLAFIIDPGDQWCRLFIYGHILGLEENAVIDRFYDDEIDSAKPR